MWWILTPAADGTTVHVIAEYVPSGIRAKPTMKLA